MRQPPFDWLARPFEGVSDPDARCLLSVLKRPSAQWTEPREPARVLNLACQHRVEMRICQSLESAEPPAWAQDWPAQLHERRKVHAVEWQIKRLKVLEFGAAFARRAGEALLLKGFALAARHYPRPEFRPFGDIDILVREADLAKARETLESLGYVLPARKTAVGAIETSYLLTAMLDTKIDIDLHWGFIGRESLVREMRVRTEDLWARSEPFEPGLRIPCREDLLVTCAVNLVRHGFGPLGNLCDFAQLVSVTPDWNLLTERARDCRTRVSLGLALALAATLFDARIPREVLDELAPRGWQRGILKRGLRPSRLLDTDRWQDGWGRYLLKLSALDTFPALVRTVAFIPFSFCRRSLAAVGARP